MGLIGTKAQLAAGVADWPTFFQVLLLGTAVAGSILFAFITTWVFGREFSDHTVKELLALTMPREIIVTAKFALIAIWVLGLTLMTYAIALGIGMAVGIPGWSIELAWTSFWSLLLISFLTYMLMPVVALIASLGRGYLPPLGWAFLTMALAQITIVLGWGDWFPWSVPALISSFSEPSVGPLQLHSYILVFLFFVAGIALSLDWWRNADQAR
jgi:ABC-2 type transport system permease protein